MENEMITAKEALALVEQSEQPSKYMLQKMDAKVREAATNGKREYVLYEDGWWDSQESYRAVNAQPTAKQTLLIKELSRLGYSVHFGRISDPYVPRGLADDDGSGPEHYNIGIKVRW